MSRNGKLTVGLLSLAHLVSDSYASMIYLLLPILKTNLGLSFYQVFWLVPIYQVSSSLMQPAYGYISDRYFRRLCTVAGPLVTAVFISCLGLSQSYLMLLVLLVLGGIGIGAFHPQSAALTSQVSGSRRRIGISIFSAAGTFGTALGPSLVALVIGASNNLHRTPLLVVYGVITSILLFKYCPPLVPPKADARPGAPLPAGFFADLKKQWRPFLLLYLITVLLSAGQLLTVAYIPFLLLRQNFSSQSVGLVLTLFLLAGGIGGLVGGFLAERMGGRRFTLYSRILAPPLLIAGFLLHGPLGLGLVALGGLLLAAPIPVNVAMAQELVPRQTSTVSALMMGFAWGVGSLAPLLAEPFRNSFGFLPTLVGSTALLGVAGCLCAYLLPKETPEPVAAAVTELSVAPVAVK